MNVEHAIQGLLVVVGVVIYIARGINKLREKAAAGVARAAAAQRVPTIQQNAANVPAPQTQAAARKLAAAQQPFVMQRGLAPQQTATQIPAGAQRTASPQQPSPQRTAAPQRPATAQRPAVPQRPRTAQQAAARTPAMDFAAEAAAFQILELTLPDAGFGDPAAPPAARRTAKRVWGANAIVAMEVLGPPVSLRSGATLGAPHAF